MADDGVGGDKAGEVVTFFRATCLDCRALLVVPSGSGRRRLLLLPPPPPPPPLCCFAAATAVAASTLVMAVVVVSARIVELRVLRIGPLKLKHNLLRLVQSLLPLTTHTEAGVRWRSDEDAIFARARCRR